MSPTVRVSLFASIFLRDIIEVKLPLGYTLSSLENTHSGLTAKLNLAGPACNAFGTDIANLSIEVTYETQSRFASISHTPVMSGHSLTKLA